MLLMMLIDLNFSQKDYCPEVMISGMPILDSQESEENL